MTLLTVSVRATQDVFFAAELCEVDVFVVTMFHPRRQSETLAQTKLQRRRRHVDGRCLAVKRKDLITLLTVVGRQVLRP